MRVKQHDATLALEAASCIVMQGLPKPAGNCSQCDATRSAHPCPPPTCRRARLQHHRRLSCHRLLLVALGGRQRVLLPNGAETAGRRWVERVITGWGWSPVWRELRIYWRTKARQRGKQHTWGGVGLLFGTSCASTGERKPGNVANSTHGGSRTPHVQTAMDSASPRRTGPQHLGAQPAQPSLFHRRL